VTFIIKKVLKKMKISRNHFTAKIEIIGINPFVFVPEDILNEIFKQAQKNKSPIPVKGTVNGKEFSQNLMKYLGEWRLYINMKMLKDSPKRIGEMIEIFLEYDDSERKICINPELEKAINADCVVRNNFEQLIPSRKLELIRYINNLKTKVSISKNIDKIIRYLRGETDFFGRNIK